MATEALCRAAAPAARVAAPAAASKAAAPLRVQRPASGRRTAVGAAPARAAASRRAAVVVRAAAATERASLIAPHGGKLVNLMLPEDKKAAAVASATKTIELSDRNACDVELLCVGAFSPLEGFMHEADYQSVVEGHRLANGLLFGLPVVLDTEREDLVVGDRVLLTYNGEELAVFTVESKWKPNKPLEAQNCYRTTSIEHPAVQMITMERGKYYMGGNHLHYLPFPSKPMITMERGKYYMGGKVEGLRLPTRVFPCATPAEVRSTLPEGVAVLAFQCRNPIHRAHYELFIRALDAPNAGPGAVCLVHPTCGPTQDDDISGIVRYRTYEVLKEEANNPRLRWAYLPYSMHMAGPREAIQHMIIRKNYGCTHFIIGRDMAGSKSCLSGEDFYGAYDAQEFATANAPELGMQTVPSLNITYTEEKGYVTADVAEKEGLHKLNLSGTKFRKMLRAGEDIPEWFAFKSVVSVLREAIAEESASESE
ncbi:Sulfate adenylyltransferase isoform A [Micractinium conductrix]|uniref:sulfate adenylyltransferase n=1 Tax=Micractinium conductrix TaxID=554055 RepID=A0A2P6VFU4_9CHLO|nr:Sulfate adenylyltransferase isoform A [Micractinium conductrix]|eukprot:PSC72960.1 Sulfate adenylyltransferase isoform A [Micractinium conductrix]